MKILGLLLLTLVSTTLSVDWYICQIKKECIGARTSLIQKAAAKQHTAVKAKDSVEIIKGRIHFKAGTKRFLSSRKVQKYLVGIVKSWESDPEQLITVIGHTDSKGSRKANYKLGLRRGIAIKKALIHYGVSKNKIKIKSYGEAKPISSNRTKKGRFYNRRVEINVK